MKFLARHTGPLMIFMVASSIGLVLAMGYRLAP